MKTLCVDFDGVIHSYTSGWKGISDIRDPPVPGAFAWLSKMVRDPDIKVCIYSSRSSQVGGIEAMRRWLYQYGFPITIIGDIDFPVVKPIAYLTIDDRAICFNGVFPTKEEINNFRPWYKK